MNVCLDALLRKHFPNEPLPNVRARVLAWCERNNCHLISIEDPRCHRLAQIARAPAFLFVLGDAELLARESVAIVGTRRPSNYGLRAGLSLSRDLALRGYPIVSGLARGVDGAAHRGALLAKGKTVAVLGHGLDRVYPASHRALAREILCAGGALVSEYPPGVPPFRHHFPERNRIISGLTLGTLVIEAARKSGSLITARLALEQNREVFVLPGPFDDFGFEGSHSLIQQGAKLVTGSEELLAEFPPTHPVRPAFTDPLLVPLRDLFKAGGGELTLEDLMEVPEPTRSQVRELLETARDQGLLAEVSPQRYVWV